MSSLSLFSAMAVLRDILDEWEGGAFYNDAYLAEGYTHFLSALLEATDDDRRDPRIPAFLRDGYTAYTRDQGDADPQALLTFRMAMAMTGGVDAQPPRPATPPLRPTSPQPGPSKRPRRRTTAPSRTTSRIRPLHWRSSKLVSANLSGSKPLFVRR